LEKIGKESKRQFHPKAVETVKSSFEFKVYELETTLFHLRLK
jgi:hypothetical protein